MSGLILYTSEDGHSRIQLRADGQTVWLTQAEMAELFDVTTENIRQSLKDIISDRELEPERTAKDSLVVQQEGGSEVRRPGRGSQPEQRKQQEARAADAADEAELAALENRIKKPLKP